MRGHHPWGLPSPWWHQATWATQGAVLYPEVQKYVSICTTCSTGTPTAQKRPVQHSLGGPRPVPGMPSESLGAKDVGVPPVTQSSSRLHVVEEDFSIWTSATAFPEHTHRPRALHLFYGTPAAHSCVLLTQAALSRLCLESYSKDGSISQPHMNFQSQGEEAH